MDGSHFDRLTKTFIEPHSLRGLSRRRGLGLLTATGLLGLVSPDAAAKKKKPCPPCKKRKKGKCKANLPDGAGCPGGSCQSGSCSAAPSDLCAGVVCGAVPNGTSGCVGGACVIVSCDAAYRNCQGGVADGCETRIGGNLEHCGACDRACPGQGDANMTVRCAGGKCEQERTYATVGSATFTAPAAGSVSV
jgi:hypothetical protein